MTCIAALEHDGAVWMGGDSYVGDDGGECATLSDPKILRRGPLLIGAAGDLAAATMAAHLLKPPEYTGGSPQTYVAGALLPAFRALLREHHMTDSTCELLIGVGGRLLFAGDDGAIHGFLDGYGAIGSGSSVAVGVLYALTCVQPKDRLRIALEAAAHHCSGVAPPFHFLHGGAAT